MKHDFGQRHPVHAIFVLCSMGKMLFWDIFWLQYLERPLEKKILASIYFNRFIIYP